MRRVLTAALGLLILAACDAGPSAVPPRTESKAADAPPQTSAPAATVRAKTTLIDGRPIWSSNRSRTAEENARHHYEEDGAALGAKSFDEFVRMAHDFTNNPPRGTQKLMRPNGDVLLYDPKDNLFAVATKDGAPRTIFRPNNGPAYWERQKREIEGGKT